MMTDMNNAQATIVSDLKEMMNGWNKIMAAAKSQHPNASGEQLFQIAKGAMNYALGIK